MVLRLASVLLSAVLGQDLSTVSPQVLSDEQRAVAQGMIDRDIHQRTHSFNGGHRERWSKVQTREQWETYRDERLARLRDSLGEWPAPGSLNVKTTRVLHGDGFRIENVLYESRPGFWVAGNLYVPAQLTDSMPGLLLVHAHHTGKRHSELQDMGMTWSRAGCLVLVIDQVGYGERRTHPFQTDRDYDKPFRPGRQDYYFRYDRGIQLQLLGDSLMGWMVWDLMRGVDLLRSRAGVDPERIAILGAVAGGGDPAAVTAALDPRIACCVAFNFGGPQPETEYPLPADAETSFNFLVFTYWDSTRGLRLGARDDFPHWVITASIAPRHLIHGHEFSWDGDRDPVWRRYQKIWGEFYEAADRIGVAHGKGLLRQQPPEATHCTHIGEYHRRMIHPLFQRWFGISAAEYSRPRENGEMECWTDQAKEELQARSLPDVMTDIASTRIKQARDRRNQSSAEERVQALRHAWRQRLGPIDPAHAPLVVSRDEHAVAGVKVERIVLEVEPGILVPLLIFLPADRTQGPLPTVIGVAQAGKTAFLKERSAEIQQLLGAGLAVVLPDVRGTGETAPGTGRGRDSAATSHSVHVQWFGETILGQRLRDLRSTMAYLDSRHDVDGRRIALWGESFSPPNDTSTDFQVPHGADGLPTFAEPLGELLGLLGGLYEDRVQAVYTSGGLLSYRSVLSHDVVLIPHDAAVPGALTIGDLCDLAAALAPRPLHLATMVDHLNRRVSLEDATAEFAPTIHAYAANAEALTFTDAPSPAAVWILQKFVIPH